MPTIWYKAKDPPDGFLCLISTRRVLDRWGHCCDYNRCRVYETDADGTVNDRCLRDIGHTGHCHLGRGWCHVPQRPWTPTGDEPVRVALDPTRFRPLRPATA